ncbi:MAG: hypothetical protein IPI96_15945 [Saprospiraceae bacterium]|mgnify:CR=1 FL=1|nr:hypothetical protein [Saprospiraceae bacterium]
MKNKKVSNETQTTSLHNGVATRSAKRNIEKQEKLVSALYKFSEGIQENTHDCKYGDKSIHLPSVRSALDDIMGIFGYDVTPIQ